MPGQKKGMEMPECPFCTVPAALSDGRDLQNAVAYVREDKFPVSPGHLLVIPKRHANDWFCLTEQEQARPSRTCTAILFRAMRAMWKIPEGACVG